MNDKVENILSFLTPKKQKLITKKLITINRCNVYNI